MRDNEGYEKIFNFLKENKLRNQTISLTDLAKAAGYKLSSIKVYHRNKLKNKYLQKKENNKHLITDEILRENKENFIRFLSQKYHDKEETTNNVVENLILNSEAAIFAAIEIHNKPHFSYRYQVVTILTINAWELLLKAFIIQDLPNVKITKNNGTTKPFDECLNCVVDTLGKDYFVLRENLNTLYEYRCKYSHFYHDNLDILLFGIIQKSILLLSDFMKQHFNKTISDNEGLHILPLGFQKPFSPIDFITDKSSIKHAPKELKDFIFGITERIKTLDHLGEEELFFIPFSIMYKNEKRLKNADLIAAINTKKQVNISVQETVNVTNRTDAKEIKIKEETIIDDIFTETYQDVISFCKSNIDNWKLNKEFHTLMKGFKKDPNLHWVRRLDPHNPKSTHKDFYHKNLYDRLCAIYIEKKKNPASTPIKLFKR